MIFEFRGHRIDTDHRQLTRSGQVIEVQPQVFELIVFLITNRDRVVSKDDLIEHVWDGRIVSDGALNARINAARQALNDDGKSQAVIKTFARKGFRFVAEADGEHEVGMVQIASTDNDIRPTLAVLPFANLSDDPEQAYFSNGITVDLSIDLAKHQGLKVLTRNAVFAIGENQEERLASIKKHAISHLVEGSVRRMADRVRVGVELIHAHSGETLWAERYDGDISRIFDFQDSIGRQIVEALNFTLVGGFDNSRPSKGTASIDAYDLYLKARERYFHYTPDGLREAIGFLKDAIQVDPDFAEAHAYLAYFYTAVRISRYFEMDDPMEMAERSARRAVELAPDSALANTWMGWVFGLRGLHEDAYSFFEKANAADPSLPEVYTYYGSICIYGGRPEKALALSERALELHSFAPPSWDFHVGQAHHVLRNYGQALKKYEQARDRIPKFTSLRLHMAAAYWEAGRFDEANKEIAAVLEIAPGYHLSMAAENYPYVDGELRNRFLDALKAAGLSNAP